MQFEKESRCPPKLIKNVVWLMIRLISLQAAIARVDWTNRANALPTLLPYWHIAIDGNSDHVLNDVLVT